MASKTKSALKTDIDTLFVNNTSGDTTNGEINTQQTNILDSLLGIAETSGTQTVGNIGSTVNYNCELQVFGVPISAKTQTSITVSDSPYTADWNRDISVDCSGGAVTINLPTAASNSSKEITITKTDSSTNKITIDADGAETINGDLTKTIAYQWTSVLLVSDGTNIGIR